MTTATLRPLRSRVPSLLALGAAASLACNDATGPRSEQTRARARWEARRPAAYEMTVRVSCFCGPDVTTPVVVSVRGGVVESRRYATTGAPVDGPIAARFPAVEGLFAEVDSVRARGAERLDVEYDPARGFPAAIAVDYRAAWADDEYWVAVSDFRAR